MRTDDNRDTHSEDHTESGAAQMARHRKTVMAVLFSGAFVMILNQTLMNTALPALMTDFDITANTAQWVTTMFMLVNGIMIPVTAFLIQKFSTRTLFFTAMGLFTLGTLLAMLAPTYSVLLAGRFFQAAGGGIIMPLMQTVLFAIYPVESRGRAMGTFGLVISFAPAIGPSLSGWVVEHFPWQALFAMMLPIAIIDLIVAAFVLKNITSYSDPSLDMLSILLSTLAFGGLLFGFGAVGELGWAAPEVFIPLIVGVITLVIFIWRQLTLDEPMLDLRIFRSLMFTLNTVLAMFAFIVMIGGMILLPMYMQDMAGFSPTESGLTLLPGALVMGVMSPFTGRIYDRFGAKWLAVIGFGIITVTTAMLTQLTTETTYTYLATVNAVRMLGTAFVMMPVTTAALNDLPQHKIPHGTALSNTLRQLAGSVGTAVMVSIMTMTSAGAAPGSQGQVDGVNVTFVVGTVLAFIGFIGSFFVKNVIPSELAKQRAEQAKQAESVEQAEAAEAN